MAKDGDQRGVGLVSSLAPLSSEQLGYVGNAPLGNRAASVHTVGAPPKRPRVAFTAEGSHSEGSDGGTGKCYVCKTAGHLYRDRPKLQEMSGQARAEALAKGRQRAAKGRRFVPR